MSKRNPIPKRSFEILMKYYENMDTHIDIGTGFPGIIADINPYIILGEVVNVKSN